MWQTISHALHIYGYPFITGLVVVECSGLIVPGETVLLAASVAAAHGHLNIWLVIVAASIGAIIGNFIGYGIGRALGNTLIAKYGPRVGLTHRRLVLGRYMFARHGGKMLFVARFLGGLRSFAAPLAGVNAMPHRSFVIWTVISGIVWPIINGYGAYALGNAAKRFSGPFTIGFAVIAVGVVMMIVHLAQRNEHRLTEDALAWEAAQRPPIEPPLARVAEEAIT
jgi:membrane protein DedA with SNARE-associated domain